MKQQESEEQEEVTLLGYQGVLPVEWERLDSPVDTATRRRQEHDNTVLLQGLLVLDEQPKVEHEEELSAFGQELQRIDYKLNLVLELLTQTLRSWRKLPEPVAVELSVEKVNWCTAEPPPQGEPVLVKLYLSPIFPNPFVATGKVTSVRRGEETNRVEVRFDGLGAQVHDALEKMVFRQHRRDVARARQRQRTASGPGVS